MKTLSVVAACVLLTTGITTARGQSSVPAEASIRVFASTSSYEKANLQQIERNFLGSLGHPVDGVVESAIREIARLKLAQPLCCSGAIIEKLHELSIEGRTPAIRYKAALTSILFENPTMFENERLFEYSNGEELFTAIARRLEKQFLTTNLE
jgi:hypothetical protein